jgi:hypothetical protein
MSDFVDALVNAFREAHSDNIHEATLQTGFVFEKHVGMGRGLTPAEQMEQRGWSQEVAETSFSEDDVIQLKEAVIQYIRQHPMEAEAGGAIWALGRAFDFSMKPILIQALRAQVDRDPGAMFQAMIALVNIDEDVFAGNTSMSLIDVEKNRDLARAYLEKQNQQGIVDG